MKLSSSEIRLKKLYDYAVVSKNEKLLESLGFITTDYIEDKNALPLSIYRLRSIIENRYNKFGNNIAKMKQDLDNCFTDSEMRCLAINKVKYYQHECLVKVASANHYQKSFWRVG